MKKILFIALYAALTMAAFAGIDNPVTDATSVGGIDSGNLLDLSTNNTADASTTNTFPGEIQFGSIAATNDPDVKVTAFTPTWPLSSSTGTTAAVTLTTNTTHLLSGTVNGTNAFIIVQDTNSWNILLSN